MRYFALLVVLIAVLGGVVPGDAQAVSYLDGLPGCNFTATAPGENVEVGAVVYNFVTGTGCAENLDTAFPTASIPKLFVAAAVYDWILNNDALSFQTELTFSERYWMDGRGDCLDWTTLNQPVSIGELSDVMIACSDNAATWMLMDAIGWEAVNDYAAGLGIDGIGEIIPYAEVDRQKLIFLDEQWARVPVAAASRYYRSERADGLSSYFDDVPVYTLQQEIDANALYFENTTFNTLTPRALASYITRLRADSPQNTTDGQVARWLFNTMLLTQRQFSAQALPGTVTVGAKNGWDTGMRAEVNVMFDRLPDQTRIPTSFALVFVRQTDFTAPDLQAPTTSDQGVLNQYLLTLSPVIRDILYPGYIPRGFINSRQLASYAVNPKLLMDRCWNDYARVGYRFDYRGQLETCWLSQPISRTAPGDDIAVGLILDNLDERDIRLTFIFTDPDGMARSYQTERFFVDSTAVYYWHPVPQGKMGVWTVEVFLDRDPILRQTVEVTALF